MRKGFDGLEKQLKALQLNLLNSSQEKGNQLDVKPSEVEEKKSPRNSNRSKSPSTVGSEENTVNWKNQLNDKLSKIQATLQSLVTEAEFSRFKA